MLNNKGQSLVLFVLIIPILLLLLVLVVDIGKMILLKQELNNINYMVIDYGVNNKIKEDKMRELINKNKRDITDIEILYDDELCITLTSDFDMMLSVIKNIDIFKIKSSYCGYMDEGRLKIERNK